MSATPGSANAAARNAGADAGAGQADAITMSCDLIRVGIFFDGTGNSRAHVGTSHIDAWHTNVDFLEVLYKKSTAKEVVQVGGETREARFGSRYMRGIGIEEGGGNQQYGLPFGTGWGTGSEGVSARVVQGISEARQEIRDQAGGLEPCDIWIDTFGFSRGAAAARDFANDVRNGGITHAGRQAVVKFMGIYDTVSSIGSGGHTGNHGDVDISTRNSAETIVHITAMDELRANFPLTLATRGKRIEVVGAHSDIGGGYSPGTDDGTVTLGSDTYSNVKDTLVEKWGFDMVTTQDSSVMGSSVRVQESQSGLNDQIRDVQYNAGYTSGHSFSFSWKAVHGLQHVTLQLMHDQAMAAGVPFDPMDSVISGQNVGMNAELRAYYEAIKDAPHRASEDMERSIRRKYTHVSISSGIVGGIVSSPEVSGRRTVARM